MGRESGVGEGGRRLPGRVRLLIAARAVNRLGAFSIPFLTVLITTDFGAGVATAGLVSAGFGLATIPSRLIGGRLADRLGRRRTIVLGLSGCALAQLAIAAAHSLLTAALCAVLLGLVFELYEPPSQAMIADAVDPSEHVRAYSALNAALAAGGLGAGLIAAGLGRWDLRWLFVVDALTCLACAVTVQCVLPADRPVKSEQPVEGDRSAWHDPALLAMLAGGTVFALVYMQIMIALPLSLIRRGLPASDTGLVLAVSAVTVIAGQPLLRLRQAAALSAPTALALGHLLLAAGLAGYAIARSLPAFLAWTVLWSLGDLLLLGRAFAVVAALAPPGASARYLSVYGTSWGIASVAAPVLGTQLLARAGVGWLWMVMAAGCLLLAGAYLVLGTPRPDRCRDARGALARCDGST
ncbi:MFS family permease [Kitasatospora sp. MAP12-15]|uniref:MFS transporter n=1 Tax=unclassified Kitasatospora TaxID=2633591 RepID=UPI0024771F52|nr:MFS transporter [Kitasatospora sp. MAP12-44]MDH6108699.1 MFS family permease [Kitasatospora sp. MAP12-44]